MQMPESLLASLEIGLNRYLAEDSVALDALTDLQDHVIGLQLREFDVQLYLRLHAGGVQLLSEHEAEPDARIQSSLPSLARALLQPQAQQAMTLSGDIQVEGNLELVQDFLAILRNADFDPEEWLAQRIGDVAAYRTGQLLRGVFDAGRRGFGGLISDGSRYLQQENGDLISAEEARGWLDAVDGLRNGVDRLEARIQRLRKLRQTDAAV